MRRGELLILEVQALMVLRVEVRVGERNSLSNLMLSDVPWRKTISSDSVYPVRCTHIRCTHTTSTVRESGEQNGQGEPKTRGWDEASLDKFNSIQLSQIQYYTILF